MQIPKLLKNSTIYMLVMVMQKGIGFFMLPIYTAYLTPEDYGIQAVVTSISSFLSVFITLGLDAAAQRFYYKYKAGPELTKRLYGTVAFAILCNSLLLGLMFIVGHKYLIDPFLGEIPFFPFALLGILYVIVTPMYLLYQGFLQTRQEGVAYGKNVLLNTILSVGLIVLFLVKFNLGVLSILLAQLIVAVIFFIYVAIRFISKLRFRIDKKILKDSFAYSLPLLPHTLANWSNGTIDKIMVNDIRNAADTGIYGLAHQYGSIMSLTANAVNQAYVPWFFQKVDSGELELVRKTANALFALICMIAVVMSLFSKEILAIMIHNPAYAEVHTVVPYIIFAFVFQFIYFFFVNILFLKNTGIIFWITISAMAINISLNLLLIPLLGITGAAIVCTLTYFTKSVIALVLSKRKNKEIKFNYVYMYALGIFAFASTLLLLHFTPSMPLVLTLLSKSALVLLLSFILYLVFRKETKIIIHQFIRK